MNSPGLNEIIEDRKRFVFSLHFLDIASGDLFQAIIRGDHLDDIEAKAKDLVTEAQGILEALAIDLLDAQEWLSTQRFWRDTPLVAPPK